MTHETTLARALEEWLAEGPTEAPVTVLSGVLVTVPRTERRGGLARRARVGGGRWVRAASMGLVAALIVAAIGLLSLAGVGALTTTPRQPVSPAPTEPRVSTSGWVPFTSERFGLSISHPAGWTATRATSPWSAGRTPSSYDGSRDEFNSDGTDGFWFAVASQPVVGVADTEWLRAYEQRSGLLEACYPPPELMERATVAGHLAYVRGNEAICRSFEAIVFVDGRAYSFLGQGFADPNQGLPFDRAHFDSFLSTVQFFPTSADDDPK